MRLLLVLAAVAALSGCKAVPEIVGVLSGAVAGGASANPAVGFAVGVAADAGSDIALKYFGRRRQQAEQDAIAAVAGAIPPGERADWHISHDIPLGNEHGQLVVLGLIDTKLASCREIAFSVEDGSGPDAARADYTANICRQANGWKWASAEPATERWGNLQ